MAVPQPPPYQKYAPTTTNRPVSTQGSEKPTYDVRSAPYVQNYAQQGNPPTSIRPEQTFSQSLGQKTPMELPLKPVDLSSPFFPPQFQNYLNNFMKNFYTPFVFKDYHINIGGPNADHVLAATVYEDAMLSPSIFTSYKTLKERNSLSQYVRSTFIIVEEGENVDFSGKQNSLNSRLKLLDLNPYNTNYFSGNPYKGLPQSLLIYRSCYPINYDKASSTVQCQKSSVGINVRIYQLSMAEYDLINPDQKRQADQQIRQKDYFDNIEKIEKLIKPVMGETRTMEILKTNAQEPEKLTKQNFDVLRELYYYDWIRNNINKEAITPNFIKSYCYFMNNDSKFNFTKNTKSMITPKKTHKKTSSDKALIILTESPNYNIWSWASNLYKVDRNINKQTYTGYKQTNVWRSVIFQILTIFYIMDKHVFTFNDMILQNNFYIKDINIGSAEPSQFWKYVIDSVDFYVPNFGHLVLFDSDYHDIPNGQNDNGQDGKMISNTVAFFTSVIQQTLGPNTTQTKKYKVIGKMFNDDEKTVKDTIRNNAKNCLNPNNFGQEFVNAGGVKPDEQILELLSRINRQLSEETDVKFKDIILKQFSLYGHNRIGTPIRQSEEKYIKKDDVYPFKKGELCARVTGHEEYEIVIFIEKDNINNSNCLSKPSKDAEITKTSIPTDLLKHFSEYEVIKQDSKMGEPFLNMDYIIETYNL